MALKIIFNKKCDGSLFRLVFIAVETRVEPKNIFAFSRQI